MSGDGALVHWSKWIRAGLLRSLSPTARDTLAVLTAFSSRDGAAFPAVSTIASLTGHRRDRIYKALKELVKVGAITREGNIKRRGLNARGPVLYRLLPPPMGTLSADVRQNGTHEAVACHEKDIVTPIGTDSAYGGVPFSGTGGVRQNGTGGVPFSGTQIGSSYLQSDREKTKGAEGGVQRGNQDTSARSASPPQAASLASDLTEQELFGPDPEAWEGEDNGDGLTRASGPCRAGLAPLAGRPGDGLNGKSATRAEIEMLRKVFNGNRVAARNYWLKTRRLEAEFDSGWPAVSPTSASGNGRCQGVSRHGECCLPVVAGTGFCRHHQAQAGVHG